MVALPSRLLLGALLTMALLRSADAVDVTGTWNVCLTCDATCTTPVTIGNVVLAQVGAQVTGSLSLTTGTPAICPVATTIVPATGIFGAGSATGLPCPILFTPAGANTASIVGRWNAAADASTGPFVATKACDPATPATCDDGDSRTVDSCSTTLSCGDAIAMPPSCIHVSCTSAADCDDGNACTTDLCDAVVGCTHGASGATACEDGDPCTTDDVCSGTTCTPGPATATITVPRLTLGRLNNLGGDDRLRFRGALAPPTTMTLDPVANGIRLILLDAMGHTVANIAAPGGAFDPGTRVGWTSANNKAVYVNRQRGSQSPISGVVLRNRSAPGTPGLVLFKIKGKRGSYTVDPAALPISIALDLDPRPTANGAGCAEFAAGACVMSPLGSTVKCR